MRKLASLVIGILIMSFSANADSIVSEENTIYGNYGKSYIFVVDTVEFSVFPDGQFDFTYIGNNDNVSISTSHVSVNYNSGFNYDMYVQYDNYGAVIQIENVPIYYDEFGRITQAGEVEVRYSNSRIVRVGGLFVHYNYYGYYSHSTGYINPYNYYYVYQPWHVFYVRPAYISCVVYDYPYRRYYAPTRYDYYDHNYYYTNRGRSTISYTNGRRSFYKPGSRVHYKGGRSKANRDYNPNRRSTTEILSNSRRTNTNVTSRTSKRTDNSYSTNNSNSRRVASNNNSKNSSTTRTQKTSYKSNVSSKKSNSRYSSANKSKSTVNKNKKTNDNSYRSNSNKSNSTNRMASSSQKNSSKKSVPNTKRTSSKRGRGL